MVYNEKVPFLIRHSLPLGYVEIIWNGSLNTEHLSAGLRELVKVLSEKQAKLLLVDASGVHALGPVEQAWIRDVLLAALQEQSLEKVARVTNPDVFGEALMSSMLQLLQMQSSLGFCLNNFTDRAEALEWLLNEVAA